MTRLLPDTRADYPFHLDLASRWNDNDPYGHVNNAVHYQLFDTVVNTWLIRAGLLDIQGDTIGLVAETGCSYFAALTFPETITAGLRVARIGTSSVTYEIGLFGEGQDETAARGHFTHVYVAADTRRPVPLSASMRETLGELTP